MKIQPKNVASRASKASGPSAKGATAKTFSLDKPGASQASGASEEATATAAASQAQRAAEPLPTMPKALQDLEKQRKTIDRLLAQAARGRDFSPQQLLRLQSTVYRYGQDLEVLSRVVDKTVGAVKQVLNTQV